MHNKRQQEKHQIHNPQTYIWYMCYVTNSQYSVVSSLQNVVVIWEQHMMSHTVCPRKGAKWFVNILRWTCFRKKKCKSFRCKRISEYNPTTLGRQIGDILPKTHCSDRHLVSSGFLPLYSPMQMPAWRMLLHTVPPHSWTSSVRLWQGGWDSEDTNMSGCSRNRSCWCSPAERCCCNRQIWEKQQILLALQSK